MIFDDQSAFPNSVCEFARFKYFELREMYAALRQKEEVLQHDLGHLTPERAAEEFQLKVDTVSRLMEEGPKRRIEVRAMLRDLLVMRTKMAFLQEVQNQICWMAANVAKATWDRDDDEEAPAKQIPLLGFEEVDE